MRPVRSPSRPQRVFAYGIAVLFLAMGVLTSPTSVSTATPPDDIWYRFAYIGQDYRFTPDGDVWTDFNYGYEGTNEGVQSCTSSPNIPWNGRTCWADRDTGRSTAFVNLRREGALTPSDPDARAGVGVSYDLRERCQGQAALVNDQNKMKVTWTYDRAYDMSASGGTVMAEIWANPLDGRGSEGALDPVNRKTTATNYQVEGPHATEPIPASSTNLKFEKDIVPAAGEHIALLYAHTRGALLPAAATTATAVSDLTLTLKSLEFKWTDTEPPTATYSYWSEHGGTGPFIGAGDGYAWFHDITHFWAEGSDNLACPKEVQFDLNQNGNVESLPYYFNNVATKEFATDGKWFPKYRSVDYKGNAQTAWSVMKFGVDRVVPSWQIETNPATPDGDNGWFKSPTTFKLKCTDATSGCRRGWYMDPWGSRYITLNSAFGLNEGSYSIHCRVEDYATHTNSSGCTTSVKIDTKLANLDFWCSTNGGTTYTDCGNPSYFNEPVLVKLRCLDPNPSSGQASFRYRLDAGDWIDYTDPFPIDQVGDHSLTVECRDLAGNVASQTRSLVYDTTPPSAPTVTGDYATNGNYLVWRYSATDDLSGIRDWHTVFDATRQDWWPITESIHYSGSGVGEGRHCFEVAARDRALNLGPYSEELCTIFDHYAPEGSIQFPQPGFLYRSDGSATWIGGTSGASNLPAVLFGNAFTFVSRASDPNPTGANAVAGVGTWETKIDGKSWAPTDNRPSCDVTLPECRQTYQGRKGLGFNVYIPDNGLHTLTLHVKDHAGNAPGTTPTVRFDYVSLIASSGTTEAGVPFAHVEWLPYEGEGRFLGYELHRGATADFQPSAVTKVYASSDPASVDFRDKTVVPGVQYYYKAVYLVEAPDATVVAQQSNSYPAKASSGGGGYGLPERVQTGEGYQFRMEG